MKNNLAQKVVALSRPSPDDVNECRMEVEGALTKIEISKFNHTMFQVPKEAKRRTTRFAGAARRLVNATKELHEEFPLLCLQIFLVWQNHENDGDVLIESDKLDANGYDQFMADIGRVLKRVECFASAEPGPQKRDSYEEQLATVWALHLLRKFSSRPVVSSKNGSFCKLAALLHGNRKAEYFHHRCRNFLKPQTPRRRTGQQ